MKTMPTRHSLAIAAFLLSAMAWSGELYRWTDENGGIHYGNTVPHAYKNRARAVHLPESDVTEAQRRNAEARVAKEKSRLGASGRMADPGRAGPAARAGDTPPTNPTGSCEEQWKKYDESWACFNPYRTANGSVKAEAYDHCTEMSAPDCQREAS